MRARARTGALVPKMLLVSRDSSWAPILYFSLSLLLSVADSLSIPLSLSLSAVFCGRHLTGHGHGLD
jgi:hypothetical protein